MLLPYCPISYPEYTYQGTRTREVPEVQGYQEQGTACEDITALYLLSTARWYYSPSSLWYVSSTHRD